MVKFLKIKPGSTRWFGNGLCDRRGTAAIEFALVITPFLLMIFSLIEFGRYMWLQNSLEYGVETASQYVYSNLAAFSGATATSTQQTLVKNSVYGALTGVDTTTVTVTFAVPASGAAITSLVDGTVTNFRTITATYPFSFLGILDLPALTITATSVVPVQ
ncbi:putative Pilus assembly protein TadE [uncultured Gammaproteobacteria bacterium]